MMTSAIVAGFQTGTQIMMAPFKFGAQAIGERIRDEMSDVRTAGGLFAISKRMEKPIFGNFAEAENYTKEQNRYLAKLAGSLPGDTQEYIQVSKQIADGIFTVVSQDAKNAQKLAQTLATTRGASAAEIAKLSGSGTTAMQATGKELVGEMTKLTVLAGLGGRQGAFGLPQLTERMIAEQKISMGMFQRYAAIFRDPMIKGALERNIKNINATGKNTAARLEALQKTFQEIVTPELVRRYQRTTAGVLEALKTAFLNPEVGLIGLGRPLGAAVTRFDEFGRAMGEIGGKMVPLVNTFEKNGKLYGYTLDKQGRATRQLVEVATEQISIFDSLRDVFANVMIVLQPIIDNIALIFDPLADLGGVLSGFRDATMKFQSAFERYREFLVGAAKDIADEKTRLQFTATIPLRASLQTINDALRAYGGYAGDAMAEFNRVSALLANPATGMEKMGRILKRMIEKFLSSEFAAKIGNGIGTVVGTVLSEVGNMMKATAGLATGSKLAEGFSAGFTAAGGPQGFADIIKSVFHVFGKLLLEMIKAAPLESAMAAALLFLPGAIAGLVSQALSGGFVAALGGGVAGAAGAGAAGAGAAGAGAVGATGLAALLAAPVVVAAIIAAATVGLAVLAKKTEKQRQELTKPLTTQANAMAKTSWDPTGKSDEAVLGNMWTSIGGELMWVVRDFIEGFGNIFAGLADLVVGLFSDPAKVKDGINKIFMGLWQLFTMCGHLIIGVLKMVPGLLVGLAVAIKNLFVGIGMAIAEAWKNRPKWTGGTGGEPQKGDKSVLGGKNVVWDGSKWAPAYGGSGTGMPMGFAKALATESRNMPSGAKPVMANSSELIIPTRAAGQGDISALTGPLQLINTKMSTVASYIERVRSEVFAVRSRLNSGVSVRVINQPTVKFDMGGMGPVGGGIGGFPKTSGYGMRWGKMHTGNDYGMPVGTKLGIGGPGKVLGAGNWGGYGNAMDIGGPGGMVYRFAHLSKINAPVGANLPPGYPFALSGNTGRSTGPHLHFEARPGGGGPVPPDAFASIIRANFAGTAIGPLMGAMQNEMKGMPYGAQLAVANSDEIFMKPKQMAGVIEGAARAGAEGTGNITTGPITISIDGYNKDPKELTEIIASQLINAMYRKSRSEVLTS
jgi:murein DD-endopeptidase MepM/ murein hydrolase activator NlpD